MCHVFKDEMYVKITCIQQDKIHVLSLSQRDSKTVCAICYGLATISRLLKIIGLFCKRAL